MGQWLERIEKIMTALALVSMFIMLAITTLNTFLRYAFRSPITGVYEVTEEYIMIFSVFLALTYTYRAGANIRVTSIVNRLSGKLRIIVNYFVQLVAILFGTTLFAGTLVFTLRRINQRLVVTDFSIPLLPAYLVVLVGLFSMTLRMVLDLRHVKQENTGLLNEDMEEGL